MAERKLTGHTQRNIRSSNLQIVLSMFRHTKTLTVRDITEKTGLSKTAISKILNELLSRGLVLPAGKGLSSEGGGKRPDLFKLSNKAAFAVAATFLPNGIIVSIYDANLTLLDSARQEPNATSTQLDSVNIIADASTFCESTSSYFDYDEAVAILAAMIQQIILKNNLLPAQIAGITVTAVGIVASDTGSLVTTLISQVWPDNLPLVEDLHKQLPFSCNIYLDNISRLGAYAFLWEKPRRYNQNIVVLY